LTTDTTQESPAHSRFATCQAVISHAAPDKLCRGRHIVGDAAIVRRFLNTNRLKV
jgi:hypothetical protein